MTELNERADSLTTDSEFRLIYGLENTAVYLIKGILEAPVKRPYPLTLRPPLRTLRPAYSVLLGLRD